MADKLPQYSDIEISFLDIQHNINPEPIDLSAVDDIIVGIKKSGRGTPDLLIKYSVTPSVFTIDNDAKSIILKVAPAQLNNATGTFSVNLWISSGGTYITHLTNTFNIDSSVKYSLT